MYIIKNNHFFIKYKKVRKLEIVGEKYRKTFLIKKICPFLRFFKFVILAYTQLVSSLQRTTLIILKGIRGGNKNES